MVILDSQTSSPKKAHVVFDVSNGNVFKVAKNIHQIIKSNTLQQNVHLQLVHLFFSPWCFYPSLVWKVIQRAPPSILKSKTTPILEKAGAIDFLPKGCMRLLCGVKGGSVGQSVLLGWTSPQQVEHLLACHQGFQYIDTTKPFFLRARMTVTKEAFILDIRDPKTKTFTCDDGILGVGSITFQFSMIRGYDFMGHYAPLIEGRCRIPNQESHQFFAKPVIRKHLRT